MGVCLVSFVKLRKIKSNWSSFPTSDCVMLSCSDRAAGGMVTIGRGSGLHHYGNEGSRMAVKSAFPTLLSVRAGMVLCLSPFSRLKLRGLPGAGPAGAVAALWRSCRQGAAPDQRQCLPAVTSPRRGLRLPGAARPEPSIAAPELGSLGFGLSSSMGRVCYMRILPFSYKHISPSSSYEEKVIYFRKYSYLRCHTSCLFTWIFLVLTRI